MTDCCGEVREVAYAIDIVPRYERKLVPFLISHNSDSIVLLLVHPIRLVERPRNERRQHRRHAERNFGATLKPSHFTTSDAPIELSVLLIIGPWRSSKLP